MRTYFHWDPAGLLRRRKKLMVLAAALCSEICTAAFFVLIFNVCTVPNEKVILRTLIIICSALLAGMLFCFIAAIACDAKIRRQSRFTYLDIQLKGLVYSSYSGEYRVAGRRVVMRDIYLVPFRELLSAATEPDGKTLLITGKLRHYCTNSENLGYHIKDGDFEFDRPYLNIGGFTVETSLRIPAVFGDPARVSGSVSKAFERWKELPAPKPYVFREADHLRLRPKARVLPESFDYSRNWKN